MPVVVDASALVELLLQRERAPAVVQAVGITEVVWQLRANVTSYDACYVALPRELDCPLVTADRKLSRAPRLGVQLRTV